MLFQPRIKTIGTVSEFMHGYDMKKVKKDVKLFNRKMGSKGIKAAITTMVGMTAIKLVTPKMAHAETTGPVDYVAGKVSEKITEKIIEGFMPLVELVKALSYPIAFVMITAGCLFIMIGQKEKGLSMIQTAGLGYILVQLSPLFMKLLAEVGSTIAMAAPFIALV